MTDDEPVDRRIAPSTLPGMTFSLGKRHTTCHALSWFARLLRMAKLASMGLRFSTLMFAVVRLDNGSEMICSLRC